MKHIFVLLFLNCSLWAATQLTYTMNVNVTNNNQGPCSTDSFSIVASMPRNWKISYAQNPISVSEQTTESDPVTITVPKSTAPGTYPVSFKIVYNGNKKYSATVNTSVTVF